MTAPLGLFGRGFETRLRRSSTDGVGLASMVSTSSTADAHGRTSKLRSYVG